VFSGITMSCKASVLNGSKQGRFLLRKIVDF
jgi:hypothetical protein